jgi:hypothetical protein
VRWVLRERGIALLGAPPARLLPAIPPEAMFNEIRANLASLLAGFEQEIGRPLAYYNSRFGQSFVALTACRMLHTLASGTVQSKKAGAAWARQAVAARWLPLIEQAWQERSGVRYGVKIGQLADPDRLYETAAFLRAALAQAGA